VPGFRVMAECCQHYQVLICELALIYVLISLWVYNNACGHFFLRWIDNTNLYRKWILVLWNDRGDCGVLRLSSSLVINLISTSAALQNDVNSMTAALFKSRCRCHYRQHLLLRVSTVRLSIQTNAAACRPVTLWNVKRYRSW